MILEAAAARSRLLELSKKLSVACISGRNEIEAASASNSKMLDFADSSLAELEKSLSDSELYGGVLKAAGRISGAVSELAASLPKKTISLADLPESFPNSRRRCACREIR